MARKRLPTQSVGPDWHIREWMNYYGKSQADMMRITGWSRATMSDIYHGRTSYYRQILNEAASALEIAPFEMLLNPDEAHALRRVRDNALAIAAQPSTPYETENFGRLEQKRAKHG